MSKSYFASTSLPLSISKLFETKISNIQLAEQKEKVGKKFYFATFRFEFPSENKCIIIFKVIFKISTQISRQNSRGKCEKSEVKSFVFNCCIKKRRKKRKKSRLAD